MFSVLEEVLLFVFAQGEKDSKEEILKAFRLFDDDETVSCVDWISMNTFMMRFYFHTHAHVHHTHTHTHTHTRAHTRTHTRAHTHTHTYTHTHAHAHTHTHTHTHTG